MFGISGEISNLRALRCDSPTSRPKKVTFPRELSEFGCIARQRVRCVWNRARSPHVIERMRIPASSDSDAGQAGGSRAGKAAHGAGDVSVVNESKVSGGLSSDHLRVGGMFRRMA